MTPRTDEYEQDNNHLNATTDDDDDDDDDGLKQDMAALARACMFNDDETETHSQEDPLLASGDAIVPFTVPSDSDSDDLECLKRVKNRYQSTDNLPPTQMTVAASDGDDDEDDFETVRAIFKRFSAYDGGGREAWDEGNQASSLIGEQDVAKCSISEYSDADELCPDSLSADNDAKLLIKSGGFDETCENDASLSSQLPKKRSSFPPSAQAFIVAIKKNRALQRFLRSKLIEIEAKIEENKKQRNNVKILKDFQVTLSRRTAKAFSLKMDPRVQLISSKKSVASNKSKSQNKKVSAMCYGPDENSHVANYKMVLERFPLSLDRKKWSNKEKENLEKGIKQQFQETVLQISVDRMCSGYSPGDTNDMDIIIESVKDIEITSERIREFLPKVNWDRLASMYVPGRTGAECESRWLNCEDKLIKRGIWTKEEDESLLNIVQKKGIRNWFDISVSLATNRLPFKCLARFQRSLNSSMINSEWTEEEDAQLCSAVAYFGESDWQSVATVLERRTGTQCSNRWRKSICPVRKGSFTPEEDERLTVAYMLFGPKWNQIAKYVPGRIQSQCRDRYLNSLDPSLKWGVWTEEEDLRLEAAITKYGYCWSKVAKDVPPRTDSQCRKRWKVICPEQVPLLQEARKRQRSLRACNFVDRESERPALALNDFIPLQMIVPPSDVSAKYLQRKRKRQTRGIPRNVKSKKHAKETQLCTEEVQTADLKKERPKRHAKKASFCPEDVQDIVRKKEKPKRHSKKARICPEEVQHKAAYSDKVKTGGGTVPFSALSNIPQKLRSKRRARKAQICSEEVENIACSDKVKSCIKSSETQDGDNITLACFLQKESKKKLSKGAKNVSQALSSSKQVENQIPCGEQDRLFMPCDIGGTEDLLMQAEVDKVKSCIKSSETQDGDNITLACFLHKKSKKKLSKGTKNASQALSSSKQVENQIPCGEQDRLFMPCDIGGTEDLLMQAEVDFSRQVRKPEDAHNLNGSNHDMPLKFYVRKKNKLIQATEGRRACSPAKLKKGSTLLHGNKPIIISDCTEPSMSKIVQDQTVLHGRVAEAEPTNINGAEVEPINVDVVEEETVLHGGVADAEPTNIDVEENDDLLISFLQNKIRKQRRKNNILK